MRFALWGVEVTAALQEGEPFSALSRADRERVIGRWLQDAPGLLRHALRGLGLLGFEAIVNRDYPIVFATLYIFSLLGLVLQLITDVTYVLVDPRIDFESRGT